MTSMGLSWEIQAWFKTRPYRQVWRSVPALVAGLGLLIFGFVVTGWTPRLMREDYAQVVSRALARKDFQTARVACERLLASGNEGRSENLLHLAIALKGLGQEAEAGVLLRLAAPTEKPGSVKAHLFVARSLLGGAEVNAASLDLAEVHLKHAVSLEPNSLEANELLGRVYMQKRNWELAKDQLMTVVGANPRVLILLSVVCRESGDEIGARGWAERAVKFGRERLEKTKGDSPADRMMWSQGLLLQEKYAEALKVLEDGRKQAGAGVYESALAEVCAGWAQALARREPQNLAQRIKVVQEGLEFAPQNAKLLQLLVQLSHLKGEEGQRARAAITRLLGEGGSAGLLHFVVGSDAWERGETELAAKHFGLAFELAPNLPAVANNMATFLAVGEKPDLPRALGIIESLLVKYPKDPYFHDTRGQILVRLGRWQEAVKDLEYALPLLPTKGSTHGALAMAYRGLGMRELAAEHERLASGGVKAGKAAKR